MKKLISILLIAIMLFSFANAKTSSVDYNFYKNIEYGDGLETVEGGFGDYSTYKNYSFGDLELKLHGGFHLSQNYENEYLFNSDVLLSVKKYDSKKVSPEYIVAEVDKNYFDNTEINFVEDFAIDNFKPIDTICHIGTIFTQNYEFFYVYLAFEYKGNTYLLTSNLIFEEDDFEESVAYNLTVFADVLKGIEFK